MVSEDGQNMAGTRGVHINWI